jgi:alpha-mannosidase
MYTVCDNRFVPYLGVIVVILKKFVRTEIAALLALAGVAACCSSTAAQEKAASATVFSLGTFDGSSGEFAAGAPRKPIVFVAGKSDPKVGWYAVQTAVLAAQVTKPQGPTTAPRTISFELTGPLAPAYRLRIALLFEKASVPSLVVHLNQTSGVFHPNPKPETRLGDISGTFNPAYSSTEIDVTLPGSGFHAGMNTLTLQAVNDAAEEVSDASLNYDAIELDRSSDAAFTASSSAEIAPTVFYRKQGSALTEELDVYLHHNGPMASKNDVDLLLAGQHFHQAIPASSDFGDEKLLFLVPEFKAGEVAHLSWNSGSHEEHLQQKLTPGKKWTLYVVPHIHLDIGFTDYQAKVGVVQSRTIDEAMDLNKEHPNFSFSIDGEWDLDQFLKTRSPAEQERAFAAIRDKHLFLPAQYAELLTGFPTAETLIRSLYPSANLSRVHNLPFDYANITDVPSYSWSYASILASAGLKDFLAASNNHHAPVLARGHLNQQSPYWWEGPDGQKILTWSSYHYSQVWSLFGLPTVVAAGHDTLPIFLQQYTRPSYRASGAILYGTQAENTDLYSSQAELVDQWNAIYAYPQMQYSGFHDALEKIHSEIGDDIPTVRGDGGPYWELGVASDALHATLERENESRALSAEKLSTLASLVDSRIGVPKPALDEMWNQMVLMDEHTWTAGSSVSDPEGDEAIKQLEVKDAYSTHAHGLLEYLIKTGTANIADSVSTQGDSIVVFNTLNWARSGEVNVDVPKGSEIVDLSTGKKVPLNLVQEGNRLLKVEFQAQAVPALGYKVFSIKRGTAAVQPSPRIESNVLEGPYYRVVLDPVSGSVQSIYDKELKQELVDTKSDYRFGQYLYVTSNDKLSNTTATWYRAKLEPKIHAASGGRILSVQKTSEGSVARLESSDLNTPSIITEIRLFDREKKIEINLALKKENVVTKEAIYVAFPFAMSHPQFQYEIQTATVDPAKDMYPGAGQEWFSVQHWVAVQQDHASAAVLPLDASLVTLGDIDREQWPTEFGTRPGNIFSLIMTNYWETNWPAGQGGDFNFRYVITSAPHTDPAALSRMGWEEMTPLEVDGVSRRDQAADVPKQWSGKEASFMTVNDSAVLLNTWKPAEDGKGEILRFMDFGGTSRQVTVKSPLFHLGYVWQTDSVERNQKSLPVQADDTFQFEMRPHEIVTVRIDKDH